MCKKLEDVMRRGLCVAMRRGRTGLLVLVLLSCLLTGGVQAQSLSFDKHTVEAETATWMGFALSDLNQDGLQDAVIQTGGWRHNATKIVAHDVSGDGRDDLVISHSESSGYPIVWYDATDPTAPEGWTPHVVGVGLNAVHTLAVADFNEDGHLDVLAGENGDSYTKQIDDDGAKQVRIFLNDGQADWTPVVFSEGGLYNGRVADINGDGRPDVAGPNGHEGDPYNVYLAQ